MFTYISAQVVLDQQQVELSAVQIAVLIPRPVRQLARDATHLAQHSPLCTVRHLCSRRYVYGLTKLFNFVAVDSRSRLTSCQCIYDCDSNCYCKDGIRTRNCSLTHIMHPFLTVIIFRKRNI